MARPPWRQFHHRVPRAFFCPISGAFMKDPVIVPSTQQTCDLEALRTRRLNSRTNPLEDHEDELLKPDLHLRSQNSKWLHKYRRTPTFAYISTPQDLETAVTTLLTQYPNDIIEDSDLLDNLRELKSDLEGKIELINSAPGSSLLLRLVEGCPVSPDNAAEWVKLSVGILAKAENIQIENPTLFANYRRPVLEVIDKVCVDIQDSDFENGLINLLYSFLKLELENTERIITSHGEVIEVLSSYILKPINHERLGSSSNGSFQKLFDVIMKLWVREEGLKKPKLSQAVAYLVWPVHSQMTNAQYLYFLHSISSVLDSRPRNPDGNNLHNYIEGSLELMTVAGLVSRVFKLLDYATLDDYRRTEVLLGWVARGRTVSLAEQDDIVMRCFQILCFLSSVTIGRLEMVRLIKCSGFDYLDIFYSVIPLFLSPGTLESHVIPGLSVLCNLVEKTRYTERENQDDSFDQFEATDFGSFDHEGLRTMAQKFLEAVSKIREDEALSDDEY